MSGDTLILYTDGLIERRDEDIDTGLTRLTSTLATCTDFGAEHLADALLACLDVASGADDDIAIVVVRLDRASGGRKVRRAFSICSAPWPPAWVEHSA